MLYWHWNSQRRNLQICLPIYIRKGHPDMSGGVEKDVGSSHKAVVQQEGCTGMAAGRIRHQGLFIRSGSSYCHNLHLPSTIFRLLDLPPADNGGV